jgi:hypothetical protein
VGDIFKAISTGFARFVFAWITPSLVSIGVFSIFLWPVVERTSVFQPIRQLTNKGAGAAAIVFAFAVIVLSVTFAYASLPIYQVLEGYSIPRFVQRPLLRRQQRKYVRLKELERRYLLTRIMPPQVTIDDFRAFPSSLEDVRPTRLGNALTAMESWATERYHLDSQIMWYELQGVSSDSIRKDTDEGRAPVDFFVCSIAQMFTLATACLGIAIVIPQARVRALSIAFIAILTMPGSYRLAVRNVLDWSQSVKAMVNLGRVGLANALGLEMPAQLEAERRMWSAYYWAIELNQRAYFRRYNSFRRPPGASISYGTADDDPQIVAD